MPHIDPASEPSARCAFPPVSADHISHCDYQYWWAKYWSFSLKSRIIPLSSEFVSYLNEDGIVLADDEDPVNDDEVEWETAIAPRNLSWETTPLADDEDDDDDETPETAIGMLPPNHRFPKEHDLIKSKINELGGAVVPKLNWSSPKDAKWISRHQNTLKCKSPNDIYLLLKSSNFVTHDLAHAFDECTPAAISRPVPFVLVLRPYFEPHPALEFRCFVKNRSLIGVSQRDNNFYSFLQVLRFKLQHKVNNFFEKTLKYTFPDPNFAFDVFVSEDHDAADGLGKVRLIDINAWAPRTDALLFTWDELLDWQVARPLYGSVSVAPESHDEPASRDSTVSEDIDFRIVERDYPAAFNFSTSAYSAHKLPKEVVDASLAGSGGLREFAQQWKQVTEGRAGDISSYGTNGT